MPKPKAKSGQAPKISLDEMLSKAATTNHLTGVGISPAPGAGEGVKTDVSAPEPTPGNEEQKGENISEAPAAETLAPVEPAAEPTPTPAAAPMPAAYPEPAPTSVRPQADPASVASVPNGENVPEVEDSSEAIPGSATSVEVAGFDLALLFVAPSEKKTAQMRLTDSHYQYLLLLGTIVGGGATPPDIVYNLVQHFIDKHDPQVQKAITKQMRQRHTKK